MSDVSSVLKDILGAVPKLIEQYVERIESAKLKRWEQVLIAADMVESLTATHVKAVAAVTKPILEENDLPASCRNFRALVNNDDLPRGYGTARGIVESALQLDQFKKAPVQVSLKLLLGELGTFQLAAFTIDSWNWSDHLSKMEELWSSLSRVDQDDSTAQREWDELRSSLESGFQPFFKENRDVGPQLLHTQEGLVKIGRAWFQAWLRSAQRSLYGGRGLNYAIGQLRMLRYE